MLYAESLECCHDVLRCCNGPQRSCAKGIRLPKQFQTRNERRRGDVERRAVFAAKNRLLLPLLHFRQCVIEARAELERLHGSSFHDIAGDIEDPMSMHSRQDESRGSASSLFGKKYFTNTARHLLSTSLALTLLLIT